MTVDIYTDLVARNRCAALAVQESVTEDEMYSMALTVGLNWYSSVANSRIFDDGVAPPYRAIELADWTPTTAATAQIVAVTQSSDPESAVIADDIATEWGVPVEDVNSKALCTGLAMMSGVEAYVGPFEP